MIETKKPFCRFFHVFCALEVAVENNRVVDACGDHGNPVSAGYTWPTLGALVLTLFVTACGGGGGGGGSDSSADTAPTVPPVAQTFTLSGTIQTSASQAVDSDTNDPTRTAVSNDSPNQPQFIPNPVTLGGYINQPGTGAEGRSRQAGDIDDYFQVDLLEGQHVTMLVGDFERADADLYLFDAQGNFVSASVDVGRVESLVVPRDGTYLVNPYAFDGATTYILAIGAPGAFEVQAPSQHVEIVPWQAVVAYKNDTQLLDASTAHEKVSRRMGLEQRAGGRGRGRLLSLRPELASAQQKHERLGKVAGKLASIADPAARAHWETLITIKNMRKDPEVLYAEPNYRVSALATPDDEAFRLQWHYPLIGLPQAWDMTTGIPDVVVAVIDTGILASHPDLQGQLVAGYDFVRDPASAGDGDGIDSNPQEPVDTTGSGSQGFHGTHVSGTVAARGNNRIGVAGSAYGSRVMPVRALGAGGGGTSYDVDQAVRFAAGLANDSNTLPAKPADIINLSLGGAPFSQSTQDLFNEVRAAGVAVVAAAGNEASAAPGYPASYDGVISVSAVDAQRRLAAYSNTGSRIDLAAPGGNSGVDLNGDGYPDGVLSTAATLSPAGVNFAYTFLNGTSMAAPHVAGVLALMKSVNPALTPDDIDAMLVAGALSDDLGQPGRDNQYGHGLINAQRAVLAAVEATGTSPADNPRLVSSASTLNFGDSSTALTLFLRNGGKGELVLSGLSASAPWLQIEPLAVDPVGLGEYQVTVNRDELSTGIYTADITALSSVNAVTVQVLVSVGGAAGGNDVGVIYVLLYDRARDETVAQYVSGGNGSDYPFQFTGVAAGDYEIVAGTDADNDVTICDAGEACGAWLTIDQPINLLVDSDITGLNFPVEFVVSLPTAAATTGTTRVGSIPEGALRRRD
ncbi:MAG: S8 family peptidase [Halioglobus sp.]|nr:S8 family peptidase [Halioglobus sp.]